MRRMPESGHQVAEAGMAATSDYPVSLLSGAQIGIADVSRTEPARQLRALFSVIPPVRGRSRKPTFVQMAPRRPLWGGFAKVSFGRSDQNVAGQALPVLRLRGSGHAYCKA